MLDDSGAYPSLTAERKTDNVPVEHEQLRHENGSFFFVMGCAFGRSMSFCQAPSVAMNSAVHSSAGSKITFLPTRRANTSR